MHNEENLSHKLFRWGHNTSPTIALTVGWLSSFVYLASSKIPLPDLIFLPLAFGISGIIEIDTFVLTNHVKNAHQNKNYALMWMCAFCALFAQGASIFMFANASAKYWAPTGPLSFMSPAWFGALMGAFVFLPPVLFQLLPRPTPHQENIGDIARRAQDMAPEGSTAVEQAYVLQGLLERQEKAQQMVRDRQLRDQIEQTQLQAKLAAAQAALLEVKEQQRQIAPPRGLLPSLKAVLVGGTGTPVKSTPKPKAPRPKTVRAGGLLPIIYKFLFGSKVSVDQPIIVDADVLSAQTPQPEVKETPAIETGTVDQSGAALVAGKERSQVQSLAPFLVEAEPSQNGNGSNGSNGKKGKGHPH